MQIQYLIIDHHLRIMFIDKNYWRIFRSIFGIQYRRSGNTSELLAKLISGYQPVTCLLNLNYHKVLPLPKGLVFPFQIEAKNLLVFDCKLFVKNTYEKSLELTVSQL